MSTCSELIAKNDYKNLDVRLVAFETRKRLITENINKFAEKLLWQNGNYYVYVFNCKSTSYTPWHDTGELRGPLSLLWNVAFIFEGTKGNTVRVVCIYGGKNFNISPKEERSQWREINTCMARAAEEYDCVAKNCRYILFNTRLLKDYDLKIWWPHGQHKDNQYNNAQLNDFESRKTKGSVLWFKEWQDRCVSNPETANYLSWNGKDYIDYDQYKSNNCHTGRDNCSNAIGTKYKNRPGGPNENIKNALGSYPIGRWDALNILEIIGTGRIKYTNTIDDKEGFCFESLREKLTPLQIVLLIIAVILFFVMVFIIVRNNCCSRRCYFGKS